MPRRWLTLLVPVIGWVLLAGWIGETAHHHSEVGVDHSCVVCSAGHAPAVSVAGSILSPPAPTIPRLPVPTLEQGPLEAVRSILGARAPPIG